MLQEIKNNFKKKSWLRLCTLHNINKWDLLDSLFEPVFPGKYFINKAPPVKIRQCRLCRVEFKLGIYKNTFIVSKQCTCGHDGTNNVTEKKLASYYEPDICKEIVSTVKQTRAKSLPNTLECWTSLGYDLDSARREVSKVQTSRSRRSPSAQPGARGYTNRSVEFWIKKGYSLDDAKIKLKESQVRNGLPYYIKKYGEPTGTEKFNQRIHQWLDSTNNKKMVRGRSKKSCQLFESLGMGYYGVNETSVRGKNKVHRVDFLHNKKIIEFFGDYWHGNPNKYTETDLIRKKLVSAIWSHDQRKIDDLCNAGYDVLKIWEFDYCNSPEDVLKLCKEFINDNVDPTDRYSCNIYRRVQQVQT
jgi:G:T-mismatch repair DNA endonuclease (very short patch repair protein)